MIRKLSHVLVALPLACALALGAAPQVARASDEGASELDQLQAQADDLVETIKRTTASYQEAAAHLEQLEEKIALSEERMAQIEQDLPVQRARTAASIKSLYIFQQSTRSLLDLMLSSESLDDFLTALRYLDAIHERNTAEVANLVRMEDDLAQVQALLQAARDEAARQEEQTRTALQEARDARNDLQAHAIAIALTESDARDAAIAIAQAALDSADTTTASFVTSSGNVATVEVPESPSVSTDELLSNTTSSETQDWAARIDAYLAGSPLEGYGATFAEAAATYGVDPRLSPAIATIESSQGTYCFLDHNAWGWGSSSWDDWESAIYEQVEGLANGYDGTLTLEGAERYCPPNYQEWYSSVASEMEGI